MLGNSMVRSESSKLDWIDRAICIYLISPIFLFCLWFAAPVGLVLLILLICGTYSALRAGSTKTGLSRNLIFVIFFLSAGWAALGGAGHFFYANSDWIIRDAVLHDLSVLAWPPRYLDAQSTTWILRAPVGYFLPAAAAGSLFGEYLADRVLYLWTVLGWALTLLSASRLFSEGRERVLCLAVLLLFGGMDILPYTWKFNGLPPLGQHLEWWSSAIQYSSNSTLLFWVPNHALPAWLATAVILRHWRQPSLALMAPLLATAAPLWSPLAAIGLFPFFFFGIDWRKHYRILFSLRSSLPFAPMAFLIMAYLGLDAATVPHGWRMQVLPFMFADIFAYWYIFFCLVEFGFLVLILAGLIKFELPFIVAILVLCALPFYYVGVSNDLAMRSSIPALMVLALAAVKPLARPSRSISYGLLVIVLIIGALGSVQEPLRALTRPHWAAMHQSIPRAVLEENGSASTIFPTHYFAREQMGWLKIFFRRSLPLNTSDLLRP